jgi:hypothetical protein
LDTTDETRQNTSRFSLEPTDYILHPSRMVAHNDWRILLLCFKGST